MASSVARMPTAEVGPFPLSSSSSSSTLPKVNVRRLQTTTETRTTTANDNDTPSSRRRTQILDRWAVQQAREMITTIERQAHNAELSALSTTTRPISARAASFLRETSPFSTESICFSSFSSSVSSSSSSSVAAASVSSSYGGGGGDHGNGSGNVDVRPNVRASSLIQMWRELEAEAGVVATPRCGVADCGGGGGEKRLGRELWNCVEKGSVVKVRCRREMEDLLERMREERVREVEVVQEMKRVAKFSHRGRIQSMLKLRFLRKDLSFQEQARPTSRKTTSRRTETEWSQNGFNIVFLRERFDHRSNNKDNGVPIRERASTIDVCCPMDSQDSGSSHSSLEMNIDNNHPQEVIPIGGPGGSPPEAISPQSSNLDIQDRSQSAELNLMHSISEELHEGSQSLELNSLHCISEYLHEGSQSPEVFSHDFISPELISMNSGSEYLPEGFLSPEPNSLFRSEEINQSPNASWDERTLWESNLDWQRTMDSPNLHGWQSEREVVREEHRPYSEVVDTSHTWMGDSYISWRSWGSGQEYHDFIESFSDNVEIRELLGRRRVTTSLESDFCVKMNHMIMSLLQKQEEQYIDEDFADEYMEQPTWGHNYELNNAVEAEQPAWGHNYILNNADEAAPDISLVPSSSYETVHYPDCSQHTTLSHHSSQNQQELKSVHGLRNEMAQMHEEISNLRKLVESCMEWQAKLQDSIKEEVSSAIRQSVQAARTSDFSKLTSSQKNNCCICNEMQVDSLLYRCGHMCTCFNCAHELQWKNGTCPICKVPIVDVVRTYPNT